ncbi:MAG TPA: ABC transporter permease [Chryseolinea sp.]|nr:ABC transporter permease [Chryseolinea sp.]
MLRSYFKTALRNILKNRFYSAVNIIGLSVGIAFTLLIGAYVWKELQVNTNLKNADRHYIIESKWKDPNQGYYQATLGPLGKALKENYPALVANYYRYDGITSNVSKGNKSFRENIQIGDSTMLNMYGFPLLSGDAGTALHQPFTAVITAAKAKKYFGKTDIVGQTITIESFSGTKHDFLVTGVLKELKNNSVTGLIDNYPGDFYVSTDNLDFFGRNMSWQNPFIVNLIELQKGISPKELEEPIARLIKQNGPPFTVDLKPELVSLKDLYLGANNGLISKMLYTLSAIALFILSMAIINFINMSVSRSASRMKEIGIRKVLGGMKKQLIVQFLTESIIIAFIATLFAFVIYLLTQDLFSSILIHPVPSLSSFPVYYILFPVLFVLVIGFIAGIYPAFVLSSLKSVESLKGKPSAKENVLMRKSLVGFQFVIASIAFIGAIIISQQVNLFLSNDLGYSKDYILSAQLPRDWTQAGVNKMENIRNRLADVSTVNNVSLSYEIPNGNNSGSAGIYKFGTDSSKAITTQALTTDENYLTVYQIPLRAGSFFDGHALDSGKVILNEAAVRALGWENISEAIGQQVRIPGDPTVFVIKGVTNDFHFGSMQQKVAPIVFLNVQFAPIYRYMSFKLKPGNIATSIDAIQKKWSSLMPGAPFEYKFMDDTLASLYRSEIQLKKASYTATILALIIVLLGVVGLISLSVQKRTKEIGIRKVLGSSVAGIVALFIKEFLLVILIGGVIACPLAYIIMNHWVEGYAYRIDITALPFIISIACLGLITALLICVQTITAANANPVKSLKTE